MKRIVFPCTNRVHLARQKSLLEALRKDFQVDIFTPSVSPEAGLEAYSILIAVEFRNFLDGKDYDLGLIRADRFELLLLAGILAYRGVKIAHIEGGASSGAKVIDTRVRDALTSLSDLHFVTDENARQRVQKLRGENVFNVGSLDVSFAAKIAQTKPERIIDEPYVLFLHHALPGENIEFIRDAVASCGLRLVGVKSNSDYQKSLMTEEYSPEDFISLMYHAEAFCGNSSALCKESSILGTPGVLIGSRQDGRIAGRNVIRVKHDDEEEIRAAISMQLAHGKYEPDPIYYRKDTEKEIVRILKELLYDRVHPLPVGIEIYS